MLNIQNDIWQFNFGKCDLKIARIAVLKSILNYVICLTNIIIIIIILKEVVVVEEEEVVVVVVKVGLGRRVRIL